MVASDYFGVETGRKVNKIDKAGFHAVKSEKVNAPVFAEYPVTLECRVKAFDDHGLWGEVIGMVVDENVLNEDGRIDFGKVQPISYDPSLNKYRLVNEIVGDAFKSGLTLKK